LNYINAKLQLLNNRIAAKIVDLNNQPNDEIRFALVTLKIIGKTELQHQIVGVDEADISKGKSRSFPIARILINKKSGRKTDINIG
jgi:transcription elongation GreA/GreB family factor